MIDLRLYLSGRTPKSDAMITELDRVLKETGIEYRMTVLDIFEHPGEAFDDAVYATPMLVKRFPAPVSRIIGDLTSRERVLVGLRIADIAKDA
jgi:circadian clock protein KaiB